ncbi:MarR family winged helix-turn-helix transcriptional regulator [Enteractinococcus helveticum]|nr:MarR family transcriptional regulator [Enteractinococcus helveticum]
MGYSRTMSEEPAQPELAEQLHRINHRLRRRWGSQLAPHGMSPHYYRALAAIAHSPHAEDGGVSGLKLRDIAERLRIAPRSATEVIDRLEERGLVQRVPHSKDRRATLVVITDEGRKLHEELRAERQRSSEEFFAVLDDADRRELSRLLGKLIEAHSRPS